MLIPPINKLDRLLIKKIYMYPFSPHVQISSSPLLKYLFLSAIANQRSPFGTYLP